MQQDVIDLSTIQDGIRQWQALIQAQDQEALLTYLTQGAYIKITRENYLFFAENTPSYLHFYPCIINDVLQFAVIDSTTDGTAPITIEGIRMLDYEPSLSLVYIKKIKKNTHQGTTSLGDWSEQCDDPITIFNAFARVFRWGFYASAWLQKKFENEQPIFQAIAVPFGDFSFLLNHDIETNNTAMCYFGLAENLEEKEIEIIVSNEPMNYNLPHIYNDVSVPIPPYSGQQAPDDYQLLVSISNGV